MQHFRGARFDGDQRFIIQRSGAMAWTCSFKHDGHNDCLIGGTGCLVPFDDGIQLEIAYDVTRNEHKRVAAHHLQAMYFAQSIASAIGVLHDDSLNLDAGVPGPH